MGELGTHAQPITDTEDNMNEPEVLVQIDPAMVIRPGDTLIVRVPLLTTAEIVHKAKEQLAKVLPDVNLVVIVGEQMAIYRPDDDTPNQVTDG
jgi:hypothetical protein